MKKLILYTAVAISAITMMTSCNDFLEVQEKGRTTIPSFLSDPRGLHAGLVGAYQTMYDYEDQEFSKYPEVAGNMCSLSITAGSSMMDQYNFVPNPSSATTADYIWRRIYEAMANVNNIIQYEPEVESSYPTQADYCQNILGQALVLRAMCHFDLCRVYAQPYNYTSDASHLGVPVLLKTPGPDDNPARATVKEVYTQVLADLNEAAGILTDDVASDYRYVSLQACNAMLSRVYLYMEDWTNALEYAKKAIGSQELAQGDDYINMYMNLNEQGEAIFRLSGEDLTGHLKTFYSTECTPADTLISLFDESDLRLNLIRPNGVKNCIKYQATTIPNNEDKREDPILFRLSEMYLNAAEAACNLGDYSTARTYIAAIINRAVGESAGTEILDACTDDNLLALIHKERVKELCFEGHNFFDITRWKQDLVRESNTTSTVKYIAYPSDYFVLPIPQDELYANGNMLPNPTVNN